MQCWCGWPLLSCGTQASHFNGLGAAEVASDGSLLLISGHKDWCSMVGRGGGGLAFSCVHLTGCNTALASLPPSSLPPSLLPSPPFAAAGSVNPESLDLSTLKEHVLDNLEADSFWCMSLMLDRIQVCACVCVCVCAHARVCV